MKSPTAAAPVAYRRQEAPAGALRLDANEGPADMFPVGSWSLDSEALRRYPDTAALEADLAALYGVASDQVLATAGGDDAIDRLCRRCLAGGRELVLTEPTFEMFARHARLSGGVVRSAPWWQGAYPLAAVKELIGPRTGLVAVVSPNNPTGAVVTADDLAGLREAAGDTPLLLDAAYAEFAAEDLTTTALALPRTLVLRTLSKAWGLAGLRVGCLLGPADLLDELRAWGQPYAVAGASVALARASLAAGEGRMRAAVATARRSCDAIVARLQAAGQEPLPSQGNFVLCRPPRPDFLRRGLASLGISVRGWPGHDLLDGCVRLTCPSTADEAALLEAALDTALAPEALLLDMDGVIADEGPSYRECIIAVAERHGCDVSRADVAAVKAAGGANNDWEATRRLLADRGVAVPLPQIVAEFQAVYEGAGDRPGLCERETLIPPRDLLARLARRLPLGIVTGRPRADAERFLSRFGLDDLFGCVVTLDDAIPKPDPAPVREALRRLGVRRAWLVGDTPDDVNAARAAGVVPLGIRPPSAADDTGPALAGAGAALILERLEQLEEMLP